MRSGFERENGSVFVGLGGGDRVGFFLIVVWGLFWVW